MSTDIVNIEEYLKYVTYPEDVAIAILFNDCLNLHLREDNIETYTSIDIDGKSRLTLELNPKNKESFGGNIYDGKVRLLYDKIDAAIVFPNGFYTHKQLSSEFSIETLLNILKRETGLIINEKDCTIVEEDGEWFIEFKNTSIFWKGRIKLKTMDEITYITGD